MKLNSLTVVALKTLSLSTLVLGIMGSVYYAFTLAKVSTPSLAIAVLVLSIMGSIFSWAIISGYTIIVENNLKSLNK